VRLTHLGHSCLLVETAGARLLIDPGVFSQGFEELTGLDAVLVTHQHVDHVDGERLVPLLEANDGARLLAEPETAAELRDVGIDAHTLHPGDDVPVGDATVTGAGGEHAVIHPEIPLIGNVGMLVRGDGEPTLFHPGDSYGTAPDGVDILALPLNAPWARVQMTIEFARSVGAPRVVPVHDGLLQARGRGVYLRVLTGLLPEGTELLDLAGAGATDC
jgi:L-ascorbate metabolism protein UlaG (beta-lactamase superfamily)